MEEVLDKKIEIDKSNWQLVKFGDVVFEPKESTKDPIADNIEHVVGLEHITSEDIHLRNSASIEESTTFTKKFDIDDVLFGRRRAYLKKAAQAKFSGICSGDITVFRAKDNLLPELLPFIVNNDKFFDYAIKHSAGGLSPRVKFKDLATYEFLLPPKDQQAKLAKLLWAMDAVVERENEVLERIELLKKSELKKVFKLGTGNNRLSKLKDICNVSSGSTAPQGDMYFYEGEFPFIRMQHLNGLEEDKYPVNFDLINLKAIEEKRLKLFKKGSILLAKSGESIRSEKKAILKTDSYVVNHLAVLNNYDSHIMKEFLFYFFQYFKLSSLISQTTTPSISLSDLGRIKIPIFELEQQKYFINKFEQIDESKSQIKSKISSSKALQKSLINQVF